MQKGYLLEGYQVVDNMDGRAGRGIQRVETSLPGLYHHQILYSPHHWTPHNCLCQMTTPSAMNWISSFICLSVTRSRLKSLVGGSNWFKQVLGFHSDSRGMGEETLAFYSGFLCGKWAPALHLCYHSGGLPTTRMWIQMLGS